jgi:hypothetical protein
VEDAAAVVAAYAVAHKLAEFRAPTNASVRKRLEAVIGQAGRIEAAERKIRKILKEATATNTRALLKKAALKFGVGHLLPADGELPAAERLAKRAARARPQVRPLSKDAPDRHPGTCRQDRSPAVQHQAVSLEVPRLIATGTSLSRSGAPVQILRPARTSRWPIAQLRHRPRRRADHQRLLLAVRGWPLPRLREFEQGGYVTSEPEVVSGRESKVYTLTDKGREAFGVGVEAWMDVTEALVETKRVAAKQSRVLQVLMLGDLPIYIDVLCIDANVEGI